MVKYVVEAEKCCCRGMKPNLVTGLGNNHRQPSQGSTHLKNCLEDYMEQLFVMLCTSKDLAVYELVKHKREEEMRWRM